MISTIPVSSSTASDVLRGLSQIESLYEHSLTLLAIKLGEQEQIIGWTPVFTGFEHTSLMIFADSSKSLEDFIEHLIRDSLWRTILTKWAHFCDSQ